MDAERQINKPFISLLIIDLLLLAVFAFTRFMKKDMAILKKTQIPEKELQNTDSVLPLNKRESPGVPEEKKEYTAPIPSSPDSSSQEGNEGDGNVVPDVAEEPPISETEVSEDMLKRIRLFSNESSVIGISYQGDSHVKAEVPVSCQDFHSYKRVNEMWSIAVVSDGAGSKKNSAVGSEAVCTAFTYYIEQMLNDEQYLNGQIPCEKKWDIEFRSILNHFQSDISARFVNASASFDSYSATIIVLVYSKYGYMVAHVGDGRAGVKCNGQWRSIITPHKGDEANQTIFSTTLDFSKHLNLKMSNVYVPETAVSTDPIEAFALMSDGCENAIWHTYQKVDLPDGDFRVEDVNTPFGPALDDMIEILDIDEEASRRSRILNFIVNSPAMKKESDDKTVLFGRIS